MARGTDAGVAAALLGVAAALVLLGATAASWVEQPVARAIGDVAVAETRATSGFELSPLAAVAALAGVVCGVALLVARGPARRVVALLAVGAAIAAALAVGVGIARVVEAGGRPTLAPWLAAAASAGMAASGLLATRRPPRRLPSRYEVDTLPDDAEWEIASDPEEGRRGRELP